MLMKVADFESRLRAIEGVLRAALTDEQRARIQFLLQTNATLVNDDWVALLSRWGIKVGVSIDGPAHVHDHRRHDKRGRGTHSAVLRGFDKLQAAHISGELAAISVLCVINPNANGTEVYNYISRELDVKGFDFLLPFMNWDTYCEETVAKTGQFLTEAFDEWAADVRNGKRTRVRIFQNILASLSRPVERFREGNALNHQVVVVESDGTILPEESLRPTYSGRFSNLTIHHNTSQQVLNDPRFFATISGSMTRAEECAGCTLIDSCASGQALGRVGMRYSRDALYQRKSVYCAAFADLYVRAAAFLIQEKGVHLSTLALASEGVDELEMGSS